MPDATIPRLTASRRVILDVLRMNGSHPTADEIHRRVRERLPKVSLGTVYRNLDYLARHGLVSAIRDAEGRKRYDASPGDHDHIWCVECGRVEDVRTDSTRHLEKLIEEQTGFEVTGHSLTFMGVCPECRRAALDARGAKRPECGGESLERKSGMRNERANAGEWKTD